MDEGRVHLWSGNNHLVAYQIDGLALLISTLGQHFQRTYWYFHSDTVFSHERACLMGLVEQVLILRDGTYSQAFVQNDVFVMANEEVGLVAYPLLAAHGLNTLSDVVVIRPVPFAVVGYDGREREVGTCVRLGNGT